MTFNDNADEFGAGSWKNVSLDFNVANGTKGKFKNLSFLFTANSIINNGTVIFLDNDYTSPPADIALYHGSKKSNSAPWDFSKDIFNNILKINEQDLESIADWARNHNGQPLPIETVDAGIKKLNEFFKILMPKKQLALVKNKNIIFKEGDNEINIEKLSSGELEVILSATYLILTMRNKTGAFSFLLIDEPEAKLHPEWQSSVLNLYKTILSNNEGEQEVQVFIATHSPFIIHKRFLDDKVIVLAKDGDGKISIPTESSFPGVTSNQLIEDAFDITDFINSSNPSLFVEGKTDEKYIKKAVEIFDYSEDFTDINISAISRKGKGGTGDMNRCLETFQSKQEILKCKIILLYDPEEEVKEESNGHIIVSKMGFITTNKIKRGVENLLNDEAIEEAKKKGFIEEGESGLYVRDDKKSKLCDWLCDEITNMEIQKKYFKNFKPLIEKIKNLLI